MKRWITSDISTNASNDQKQMFDTCNRVRNKSTQIRDKKDRLWVKCLIGTLEPNSVKTLPTLPYIPKIFACSGLLNSCYRKLFLLNPFSQKLENILISASVFDRQATIDL